MGGKRVDQSAVLSATLINGAGTPLGKLITDRLRENLEEAVNAVLSQRAALLRSEGDKARALGNLDQAESSYLQAILMGRSAGGLFRADIRAFRRRDSRDIERETREQAPASAHQSRAASLRYR